MIDTKLQNYIDYEVKPVIKDKKLIWLQDYSEIC